MKTNSKHFESQFLILTDTGTFILQSYRPTDPYTGQRASNLPTLWLVPYLDNPSHNMNVGEKVTICRNYQNMAGPAKQAGRIIAKKQRYWDYSKPEGQREEIVFLSPTWEENLKYYQNQNNKK